MYLKICFPTISANASLAAATTRKNDADELYSVYCMSARTQLVAHPVVALFPLIKTIRDKKQIERIYLIPYFCFSKSMSIVTDSAG